MNPETKNCTQCKTDFTIRPEDFTFYEKIKVPPPAACPTCRAQLRLSFRNERSFYKSTCARCTKPIVSMYSPNKAYTVWCYDCWFSDNWDPANFAKEYDPNRPFIEQFNELWSRVPKIALFYIRSVNSEYSNISADNKDSYMIVESSNNENCLYAYWLQRCTDCVDSSFSVSTSLSYESDDCYDSYQLHYSKGCHDCRDSAFLLNCRNTSDSLGCVNLRNAQYCVFNKQMSKEEYERVLQEARLDTASGVEAFRKKFAEFLKTQPNRYAEITNALSSTGNYIKNSKNCTACFHAYDSEDCAYSVHVWEGAKDCMDCDTTGRTSSMMYNSINAGIGVAHEICCAMCWESQFMEYSYYCFNSQNCFGSVGLRKKQYCILNKQYTKEEYEALRETIVSSMHSEGVYGDFFPPSVSTFGYNESAAQDQFPLTKEEAIAKGFKWEDHPRGTFGKETVAWEDVPDSIDDIGALDVPKQIFVCTECTKNYRIIPAEFEFYKRMHIPLPRTCPDCRHARRFAARGPNRLWGRTCQCAGATSSNDVYQNTATHTHENQPCPTTLETSYAPDRPEIVYCEQCYNAEVA